MRRRWIVLPVIALFAWSFIYFQNQQDAVKAAGTDYLLAGTDQASHKIMIFDPNDSNWNDAGSVVWEWAPTSANGFSGLTSAWGLPNEVRIRDNCIFGGQWMIVTDSYGLAAIVPYPAGNSKKWGLNVGGNPHSAELLPNGNIAIAASSGNWLRVYTSSQGPSSSTYAQYSLEGAHAALWDPERELLWSVGDYHLVALKIRGTNAAPTIQEYLKVELPPEYKDGVLRDKPSGHDLQPVYGNTDRLWVSTGMHVYQYIKSSNSFDLSYTGNADINRPGVKSVGNQLSGQVVSTRPDYMKTPPGGCVLNAWCMDTAEFHNPNDSRTRTGAAFYKVRVLSPNYQ